MDLTPEEERYKQKVLSEINGLLGAHLALTASQYKSLMDKVEAETLAQLVLARQSARSPLALEQDRVDAANREVLREREIELNGYHLSASAFSQFLPTIRAVGFMPDPAGSTLDGKPTLDALYTASSHDHREASVGRDRLNGICDTEAVGGFVRTLRRNYEVLRRSQMLRHQDVRLIASRHVCAECRKLDGRYMGVSALLGLYELNAAPFPHELQSDDEAAWCPGPMLMFAADDLFGLRR